MCSHLLYIGVHPCTLCLSCVLSIFLKISESVSFIWPLKSNIFSPLDNLRLFKVFLQYWKEGTKCFVFFPCDLTPEVCVCTCICVCTSVCFTSTDLQHIMDKIFRTLTLPSSKLWNFYTNVKRFRVFLFLIFLIIFFLKCLLISFPLG